jgi:hypothetical protein
MWKITLVAFVLVGMVGGCGVGGVAPHLAEECRLTTPPASGARLNCLQRASVQSESLQRQEYFQGLAKLCDSFGMQRGTPAFNQCVYQQQQIDTQNNANAEASRLIQMQQAMQLLNPPRQSQINPSITCTTLPGSRITTCD